MALIHQISLSEVEASWLAGLIDGEGYVGIRKVQTAEDGYTSYQPALSVVMTCKETIEYLHSKVQGGSIKPREMPGNRKPQYTWRPTRTSSILEVLEYIEPYSITKKSQIQFLKEICIRKLQHRRGSRVEDTYYTLLCEKLSTMNTRGVQ